MANTRKSRVPKEEQLKLINECRTSGMTDIDWCREHGILLLGKAASKGSCPDILFNHESERRGENFVTLMTTSEKKAEKQVEQKKEVFC